MLNFVCATLKIWYSSNMKTLLEFKINQVFFNDPLLWLWLMLGVIGLVGLGLLLSWFFGRPVLKFYVDGEVKSMLPCKRGEKIAIPIDLQEYKWFWNKEMCLKKKFFL